MDINDINIGGKKILLNTTPTGNGRFVAIQSNADECKKIGDILSRLKPNDKKCVELFKNTFGIDYKHVVVYGVGTPRDGILSKILSTTEFNGRATYDCFVNPNVVKRIKAGQLVGGEPPHVDKSSAWNCLHQTLGSPTHIIIIKFYNNG